MNPVVSILMGSKSDLAVMTKAKEILDWFGVASEVKIISAHRTPDQMFTYAESLPESDIKVVIAGAGAAAHVAGMMASKTLIPVLGVPLSGTSLNGLDALLSTVQMPAGVPVATFAIGEAGVKNAALFACRILALENQELQEKLRKYQLDQLNKVLEANNNL
ncbi:MAG: 5-(carboxyamino)imidazole ribonucleotide mutase [Candidatus Izemoplasmatales bacterium]|nr:5-(carboxyamino)imidazole ribonucleotide mutase [Candidatus Izemoplasmatales bacterium]